MRTAMSSGTSAASAPMARPRRPGTEDFTPSKVAVKGFVSDWPRRGEQGLTHDETLQYLTDLIQRLPQRVLKAPGNLTPAW